MSPCPASARPADPLPSPATAAPASGRLSRRAWLGRSAGRLWACVALPLAGCALTGARAPRVELAGLEPLGGEGLELRLLVKLRVKNPSEFDLSYDGLWLEIDLDGKGLASGGAPVRGRVPRYGDTVVALPMTVSGFALARQAWGLLARASGSAPGATAPVRYRIRGHLGGTGLGGGEFDHQGELDLGKLPT